MLQPGIRVGVLLSAGGFRSAAAVASGAAREAGRRAERGALNHKLRGKASDADEKFVATGGEAGLEFHLLPFTCEESKKGAGQS